ncbi:MAG: EAL domain-containing protein, partial [Aquificota bacterium]
MHEECGKCNAIGGLREEPATLVFIAESELLRQKLKKQLEDLSYEFYDEEDSITLQVSGLKSFFYRFYEAKGLSEIESQDIWLVVLSPGERFRSYHVKNARNLNFWLSQVACDEYMEILREKRLMVYFHPIVDSNLSVVGFECLIRGINQKGSQVSPAYLFECAEKTDSLFYLDRACREIAIQKSAERGLRETLIFINFVPTSIYNPETCLQTTIRLVNTYNLRHENIVFEVVESHQVRDIKHLRNIMDY